MASLQWDEKGKRENKSQRNDACDASIYARGAITRYINHAEPVADPVKTPDQEHLDAIFKRIDGRQRLAVPVRADFQPGRPYRPDPRG
jgi:hypothetical protein